MTAYILPLKQPVSLSNQIKRWHGVRRPPGRIHRKRRASGPSKHRAGYPCSPKTRGPYPGNAWALPDPGRRAPNGPGGFSIFLIPRDRSQRLFPEEFCRQATLFSRPLIIIESPGIYRLFSQIGSNTTKLFLHFRTIILAWMPSVRPTKKISGGFGRFLLQLPSYRLTKASQKHFRSDKQRNFPWHKPCSTDSRSPRGFP